MQSQSYLNLEPFQKYLCKLNYFTDFKEDSDLINKNPETDENELKRHSSQGEIASKELVPIPNSFMDMEEYIKIWQAMFFLEAKAQIMKAKFLEGEEQETYCLKAADPKHNFHILQFNLAEPSKNIPYAYHDLLLISPHKDQTKAPNIEQEHLLGLLESSEFSSLKVRIFLQTHPTEDATEPYNRFVQIQNYFGNDSIWYLQKICNVVTLDREYQALHSIYDLYLKETLITPSKTLKNIKIGNHFSIPQKLESKLREMYNQSQFEAIKATLKKEGVTLIQGPPGTGKTTTVLGTISVLLNSLIDPNTNIRKKGLLQDTQAMNQSLDEEIREKEQKKRPWLMNGFKDWRDEFGEELEMNSRTVFYPDSQHTDQSIILHSNKIKNATPPEKILICAPSNAAIDEIVRKILEKGLLDANGNRIDPFLVRIGPNIDRSLEAVSLDYLVEKEIQLRDIKEDTNNSIRVEILKKAKLVCGTLNSTGSQILLANPQSFDTVVIDEAAQGIEISTLIPLKYGCKRLILIGDPQQLPATIFSKKCEKYKYDLSLFERLQKNEYPVFLLKSQYRMHPLISKFISTTFYNSDITDAPEIMSLIGNPSLYSHKAFQPFVFFHIEGYETFAMNSFKNEEESNFIVILYEQIKKKFADFNTKKLGVISPYSQQVYEIRRKVQTAENSLHCTLEVNTVDGFQGREKDLIIFSTVRSRKKEENSKEKKTIGFLRDKRRMNVSLSRARVCLIVVGNAKRLRISKVWRGLIEFAMNNRSCYRVKDINETFFNEMEADSEKLLIKSFEDLKQKN